MQKASIDQRAGILTDMLRTIPMEEKHDKLKGLFEDFIMENDESCEESLKVLFSRTD